MLSKKFLRDGEKSFPAAWATSGITMEAVKAAAVRPVTVFSFKDAWIPPSLDFETWVLFDWGRGSGFKKGAEDGWWLCSFLWVAGLSGRAIETEAEAIIGFGWTQEGIWG